MITHVGADGIELGVRREDFDVDVAGVDVGADGIELGVRREDFDGTALNNTSCLLEVYCRPRAPLSLLVLGCFWQRRMQRSSTSRLLVREDAGELADKKHL